MEGFITKYLYYKQRLYQNTNLYEFQNTLQPNLNYVYI